MPLDTSLSSEYLASRFGEDPLPVTIRGTKLGKVSDGFHEEQVQPPIKLKLPFPMQNLKSFVLRLVGQPGSSVVGTEGIGGSGGEGGTSAGTSGAGAGGMQGSTFFQNMLASNPNAFGDASLGHHYVSSPTDPLKQTITLWPPHSSALMLTDPSSPHAGPPLIQAQTPWIAPSGVSGAVAAAVAIAIVGVEYQANKNVANGYAGLNGVSRITKGAITTDDLIVDSTTTGLVLKSPNGHYWRFSVDNSGILTTTDLGGIAP